VTKPPDQKPAKEDSRLPRPLRRFFAGPSAGGDAAPSEIAVSEEGRIKSGKLAGLTMWHAIWVLAWPVLIESFLNAAVGLVDTTLAANLGESATDAVGAASYFLWFIGLVGMSIGVGVTAMIARAMGKGRVAAANAALGQSAVVAAAAGIAVGILIATLAPNIASLLAMEGDAKAMAIRYLRILAVGVPAQTILLSSIAACRGAGDSLRPLRVMAMVNTVNIAASFILAGTPFAITQIQNGETARRTLIPAVETFSLGITGVAWGSVIAWYVGLALILSGLIRGTHGLKLMRHRIRLHARTLTRLLRVGTPNFIETFGMWFGNFIIIFFVGRAQARLIDEGLSTGGLLGSHIIAIRVEALSFLPGFAMSLAAATLAGQYLGARSPRLARTAVLRCTAIAAAIMFCFGVAFLTIPQHIVGLLSPEPAHLRLSPQLLFVCGITQVPFAIGICIRGSLRGAGDTRTVMILTWISTYLVRVPLAWLASGVQLSLFGITLHNPAPLQTHFDIHPLVAIWIALCTEHVVRASFFVARFLQGGWQHVKV
jgi:putative MATE family efflux protein